jgi:hypothetical protein
MEDEPDTTEAEIAAERAAESREALEQMTDAELSHHVEALPGEGDETDGSP